MDLRPAALRKALRRIPWRHPAFGWVWLVRLLIICAYAGGTYGAFVARPFGAASEKAGDVVAVMSTFTVALFASAIVGPVSFRVRRREPFVIATGVTAAGIAAVGVLELMTTASIPGGVYVAAGVLVVGLAMFISIDTARCVRMPRSSDYAGKKSRDRQTGQHTFAARRAVRRPSPGQPRRTPGHQRHPRRPRPRQPLSRRSGRRRSILRGRCVS
ncbi:hypothetical protein ACFQYP_19625 [Nonomuraea antimicrobica]